MPAPPPGGPAPRRGPALAHKQEVSERPGEKREGCQLLPLRDPIPQSACLSQAFELRKCVCVGGGFKIGQLEMSDQGLEDSIEVANLQVGGTGDLPE